MRRTGLAIILLLGLGATPAAGGDNTYPVFKVTGVITGVPPGTPARIEAVGGTCCPKCKERCGAECDGTSCEDPRCCALTADVDLLDARGEFEFYVDGGTYDVIAVDQEGNQFVVFERVVINDGGRIGTRDIKSAKPYQRKK
jgi:hypothetical protein